MYLNDVFLCTIVLLWFMRIRILSVCLVLCSSTDISDCLSNSLSNNTSITSVQNQNLNETVRNATVSVPPTEHVIYIGNSSINAIQDMDFFPSDIQALVDNAFDLEDIVLPVISHNHDNSSTVPTNTSIDSQVRNVNEYNYSAGPNELNTYQNNMATFP